jgi:thiamine pyrophosphate-dependent acetolactate synthase large subunit-like protein
MGGVSNVKATGDPPGREHVKGGSKDELAQALESALAHPGPALVCIATDAELI